MKTSPLTSAQWNDLAAKSTSANQSLSDLHIALLLEASRAEKAGDSFLYGKLMQEADQIHSISITPAYFFSCQPEWTGGDSRDPKNHVLREPHLTNRRFTVL